MVKHLGIDYGEKRVGLALSGPGGVVVPWRVIQNRGREQVMADLVAIVRDEAVQAVVVGLPRAMDGSETETTRRARNAAKRLARRIEAEVFLMDEELSSFEAEEDLRQAGLRGDKLKRAMDAQAAARILESFLRLDPSDRMGVDA